MTKGELIDALAGYADSAEVVIGTGVLISDEGEPEYFDARTSAPIHSVIDGPDGAAAIMFVSDDDEDEAAEEAAG